MKDITPNELLQGGVDLQNNLCWGFAGVILLLLFIVYLIRKS